MVTPVAPVTLPTELLPPAARVWVHRRIPLESVQMSLIIPTLQEESTLGKTLAQFPLELRERYGIELIISDGGSTDATLPCAHAHADVVIEYTGTERQTIAQGRNWGARVAEGHVLVFLNADSVPAESDRFAQTVLRWAATAPAEEVALACPITVHPECATWKDRLFHAVYNRYIGLLNTCGLGMGRGECHIVRRWAFWQVGGYDERLAAGEDFELYRRLRRLGKIRMAWELLIYESPRRYRRYGYARTLWLWTLNAASVLLLRRSISRKWEPVREMSHVPPPDTC
ncbi:PGL/p-HBAD biosynthesis glycosyltransferase [bacterium HR21]|nr:PGL/p-HBAD biosynthesis glycosyltransferase [bacterium HR21]